MEGKKTKQEGRTAPSSGSWLSLRVRRCPLHGCSFLFPAVVNVESSLLVDISGLFTHTHTHTVVNTHIVSPTASVLAALCEQSHSPPGLTWTKRGHFGPRFLSAAGVKARWAAGALCWSWRHTSDKWGRSTVCTLCLDTWKVKVQVQKTRVFEVT